MEDAVVRPGRKCSKGHSIDPSWETCPYCEAEQKSRQKTRVEGATPRNPEGDRITKETSVQGNPGNRVGEEDARRIVGVLVTYTWRREGQIFPVREGKNFIGRGEISSEAHHRPCDIQVSQDSTMSAEHALILCRQGGYEILDQISANGTVLNGTMLKANQGVELPNNAEIRTGATLWTFIRIQGPQASSEVKPPTPPPPGGSGSSEGTGVG